MQYGVKRDLWGKIDKYKQRPVVYITLEGLKKILGDINRLDEVMMRQMRDEGYMVYFKDRFLKGVVIGANKPSCYCFYLKAGKEPPTEEEQKREKKMVENLARMAREHALKKATQSCLDI